MSTSAQSGSGLRGTRRDPAAAKEVYGLSRGDGQRRQVVHYDSMQTTPRLPSALLLAMRRGDEERFVELCDAEGPALGRRGLEDALDEAWRTARALNLPLSEDMQRCVVVNLAVFRYALSWVDPTSDVPPPAADAHVRWHELWGRVDLLLEYSRRLQDELHRLQGHDRAPGSADLSLMLARMCALVLHGVKGSLAATYKDVPWEEMEYLLLMFIEARTVFVTLAHLVATASSTAAHLRCFRERVEKYVLVHRTERDPEAAMKRLKEEPSEGRADPFGVVDSALTGLRKDFTLLRDWHSLKDINEVLDVTSEALSLQDDAWGAWGWLALRWALFVVGERAKYSWTSPNLSCRWAVLVDAMAPGGVREIMKNIRDDQEHGKDKFKTKTTKTMALPKMTGSERKGLSDELLKLINAARAALQAAESEEWTVASDWEGKERVTVAKAHREGWKDLIGEEILKILEPAKNKARGDFEKLCAVAHRRIERNSKDTFLTSKSLISKSLSFAHEHIPEVAPRIYRLLLYKSAEHTESFQAELREATSSVSSPLGTLKRSLTAVFAAPVGQLRYFATLGALRELASRWHERDQVVPTAVPFSPALFGRQLRNYLNHLDEVFGSHPHIEVSALCNLLHHKLIPLEHGARPRLRDPRWSRDENERLLHLVGLKSDMFRCAREGDLDDLQRLVLVEDGDMSARDCQDRTLLHAAAHGDQVHVVRWLLGLGAGAVDPLAGDWLGHTALHAAGTAAVAEALLAANPAYYSDRQQPEALTPLHHAAASGRAEVVAVLLRDPRDLDAVQHTGRTPLHLAARRGHDQVVRLLLDAGARCQADADGHAPLVLAAGSGSAPAVRLLLGAAPPPADEDCWTAAEVAAAIAHDEACSVLLDELEARERLQWGPCARGLLFQAGCGGSSAVALRLLDLPAATLGERLDDTTGAGATVLHVAASKGRAGLVRGLLSRGADPLCETASGHTALDYAAAGGSPDIIDALVEHIPGGSLQVALGQALCEAVLTGQLGAAQRLVHHGADVNHVNAVGGAGLTLMTPLGWAAQVGHTEVVQWLLQRGADPRQGGYLPLHKAAMYGQLGVVKLLVPPLGQGQDDPGGQEPGPEDSRHLPMTRPERKAEESAEKRRKQEARKARDARAEECLRLLQQVCEGRTALHRAAVVSALPVVEYLLKREDELLRQVHSLRRPTGVPTVYTRDADGYTALQYGAEVPCAPSVAEALLVRMGNKKWLALGDKNLQEVREMAVEALELAVPQTGSRRLVCALCEWLLEEKDEDQLQDIRRGAVVALGSGQHVWHAVVDLVRWHLEAPSVDLVDLQLCAVLAMRRCLQLGSRGEKALQLLCLWVRDLSGCTVDDEDVRVMLRLANEARAISALRGDLDSFHAIRRFLAGDD